VYVVLAYDAATPERSSIVETYTNAQGRFDFLELQPGRYMIVAEPLPGYFSTTAQVLELEVSAGSNLVVVFGQCSYAYRVHSPLLLRDQSPLEPSF